MILLARHGQTDFNAPPVRIQGSLDPPLNETGLAQARELAELVAGEGIRALYASDMLRARMTAEIVGERIGVEPVIEPRVRECDWGSWEGRLVDDIAREEPGRWQAWLRAGEAFRFPDGESLPEHMARTTAALEDVRTGELPALVVCHGGTDPRRACRSRPARARQLPRLPPAQRPAREVRGVTAAPPRRAAAIVFALFVLATGGAFFVTQRLKRSTPIVTRVFFYQWIGPDCRCPKARVTVRFDLPKAQNVTASLVNRRDEIVKTFTDDQFLSKGTHPFVWNGRDDSGNVAPDGSYRLRVGLPEEGRSVTAPRVLHVDTRPPRPRIVAVTPPTLVPGSNSRRARARLRFVGPANPAADIAVWRTDGGKALQVDGFKGRRGRTTATWDGTVNGKPAPEGSYAFSVTVQDKAGNRGSVPASRPPTRAEAVRRSGVAVAYFTLTGPVVPVKPGAIARFTVGPLPRPTRWRLAPYGRGGVIRSGLSHGSTIAVRIPKDAGGDVYSMFATAGGRHAAWPVVVGDAGGATPVLVVVPAMTWQGQNPVDSNRDGWPDTLDAGDARRRSARLPARSAAGVDRDRHGAHARVPDADPRQLRPDDRRGSGGGKTPAHRAATTASCSPAASAGSRRSSTCSCGASSRAAAPWRRSARTRSAAVPTCARASWSTRRAAGAPTSSASARRRSGAPRHRSWCRRTSSGIFSGSDGFVGSFTRFERSDALDPKAALLTAGRPADGDRASPSPTSSPTRSARGS